MEFKEIDEERGERGKTPDKLDAGHQQRRGSNLLAAAGIGYENRRKQSHQNAEAQGKIFQEGNEVYVQEKDGKMTKLEVVEVREKMGLLRRAVPILPTPIALIFCLFNAVLPGTGTIMGALSLFCCGKCRHETPSKGIKFGMIAALLQILTAVFIVGWIYSIVYGVNMVQDAMLKREKNPDDPSHQEDPNKDRDTVEENNKPPQSTQAWT